MALLAGLPEPWKLIGVALVAAGFALRLHPLLVVLAAAIATQLVSGVGPLDLLEQLGTLFLDNRFTTLPIVLLMPLIGLLERHGLQQRAAALIRGAANATAGRVLFAYQSLREVASMFGLAIGGHAQMIRPLVAPMAEGAARRKVAELPAALTMKLRAHAAAAENWGNFFADDVFVAVGPVVIIQGVFKGAGIEVAIQSIGWWGLPTALFALLLGIWRYRKLEREIDAAAMSAATTASVATAAVARSSGSFGSSGAPR